VTDARASDSMFLFIDFVRVTNCFYDYDYMVLCSLRMVPEMQKIPRLYMVSDNMYSDSTERIIHSTKYGSEIL